MTPPPPPSRPLVAVLSDTHGDLPAARRAFRALAPFPLSFLVHCGDIGENVLSLLSGECAARSIRAVLALGNCDPWLPPVPFVHISKSPRFPLGPLSCAAIHGDDPGTLDAVLASGLYDVVFTGHTHVPSVLRIPSPRPVLLLNPGSPARPRSSPPCPTVALLDPSASPLSPRILPV